MQTTTAQFQQFAKNSIRPLAWQFRASWDKAFDPDVTFFTLDQSILDGADVLAPSDSDVAQEWDKYLYLDYTDRIINMEWQREEQVPYSVTLAIADIVLNNYDGYFTRGSTSPIDNYLLPRRPIRLLSGFKNESIPQFVGLTTNVPSVNTGGRTASIHAQDFLSFLFNRPLDQTVVFEDKNTAEILEELFTIFGLIPGQYNLEMAFNTVKFAFFEKGSKFGDIAKQLMQAELGTLYMDELGVIQFKNRYRASTMPIYDFNETNIVDYSISEESSIINVVEVKSKVREVQPTQAVFTLSSPVFLPGAMSTEIFFSFEDPVVSLETISGYLAFANQDGTGTDLTTSISVVDTDLFSTSVKVTFANSGANAYLTQLILYGDPAKVVKDIYLRVQDDNSVEEFEEQPILIENDFIQDTDGANSIALSLLNYYKDYSNTIEMEVIVNPALQIGDNIQVDIDSISSVYTISKLSESLQGARYKQKISAKVYNVPLFFVLDQSILDGTDVLAI